MHSLSSLIYYSSINKTQQFVYIKGTINVDLDFKRPSQALSGCGNNKD